MMKVIISFLAIVSFVAISCGSSQTNGGTATAQTEQKTGTFINVSVADLNNAMNKGGEFVILDVRTPGELTSGYVDGAINMDINNASFKSDAVKLDDKSETVYVYCRSGHRSQTASKVLISMGFTDVRNVEGGFIEWSQKGYKSVK